MRGWIGLLAGAWLLALAIGGFPQPGDARTLSAIKPMADCAALATRTYAAEGAPVRVTSAKPVEGHTPYCRIQGYVAPAVHFELRLPSADWRQRLLFTGCGGFCGMVAIRAPAAEGCVPVTDGSLAMVASDLGHQAASSDGAWASGNPQGIADYGHRAVHVVTLAAKALIAAYYGQAPRYAYFDGCSDGGREGMMEAQRYPEDFDGIVAGAPVIDDTANNSIYHAWNVQHLLTRDGKPVLPDALLGVVADEVLRQCDRLDGVKDNVLAAPERCRFDATPLLCSHDRRSDCLTPDQAAAVDAVHQGPTGAAGRKLYEGAPLGSERSWNSWATLARALGSSFVTYMTGGPFTGEKDLFAVRYDAASINGYNRYARDINALDANLAPFAAHGKLLMWHGWTDAGVPAGSSIRYHDRVRAKLGAAATAQFMRLYMLPGVNHCGGGDGPDKLDLLTPLMAWVEDGHAPDLVIAWHAGSDDRRTDWRIHPYSGEIAYPVGAMPK